jgi:hypothetical protein
MISIAVCTDWLMAYGKFECRIVGVRNISSGTALER